MKTCLSILLELCYLLRGAVIPILIWDDKFHHVVFLSISAVLVLVVQILDHIFSELIQFVGKVIVQDFVLFVRSFILWSIHRFRSLIMYTTHMMHVKIKFCILFGNVFFEFCIFIDIVIIKTGK